MKKFVSKIKTWIGGLYRVYTHELSLVLHDGGLLLFFTFLPLVYPVLYSLIYNPELVKDVPIVVVDNDRTPLSREMTRKIDACDEAWVRGYAADMNEARDAMAREKCFGILEIPEGMERKIGNGETAPAVLYCDMRLLLRYKGLLVATTEVMQDMSTELMTEQIDRVGPLALTLTDGNLLPIENANMGNIQGGFDSFIMPAILILILQQCLILVVGMAGGAKHEDPRLIRYNPDNVSRSVLGTMIGQALCYMTIMFVPTIFMVHYVPLIFSLPMAGDVWQELLFLLPMALASIGMGFVFQAIVTERESVFLSWVVTSAFFLFISGVIWPRCDMPTVWRYISDILPASWGVEGFIKMNGNGSTLAQVSNDYTGLWIVTVIWWVIGWCAQKWVVRPEIKRWRALSSSAAYAMNHNETEGQN